MLSVEDKLEILKLLYSRTLYGTIISTIITIIHVSGCFHLSRHSSFSWYQTVQIIEEELYVGLRLSFRRLGLVKIVVNINTYKSSTSKKSHLTDICQFK